MSASSRGWRAVSALSRRYPQICSQCARDRTLPWQQRWAYSATAAATTAEQTSASTPPPPASPSEQILNPVTHPKSFYRIRSGLILTRAPLLTREPTPFEEAFFLYQKRLNERLVTPFIKQLYFKPDTPPELDWKLKLKQRRGTVAKDVGHYKPRGVSGWNDEAPLDSKLADTTLLRERLVADSEMRYSDDGELIAEQDRVPVEMPMPRRTEADEKNDVRRLDRALDRTLYLVVKYKNGTWGFPTSDVRTDENLHETAARALEQAAGVNMNTWMVGRVPVAHSVQKPVFAEDDPTTLKERGIKTFFLKGRILAGQADLNDNTLGVTDFMWLTREEIKKQLPLDYTWSVRNMYAER